MDELAVEIVEKRILHWNCRGFEEMPHALKDGQNIQEIYLKWNKLSNLVSHNRKMTLNNVKYYTVVINICLFQPSWIGKLKNVTNLYLQYNQLICLPDELSELSELTVLDVTSNLICALPVGIGHLHKLNQFLAADNALSGIPDGGF